MRKCNYRPYYNNSDENIIVNQIVISKKSPKQILGIAVHAIPKGGSGWLQISGPATIQVAEKVTENWYDKNDLDSILGVK